MKPEARILIQATRLLPVVLLSLGLGTVSVAAQSDTIAWSTPINLSNTLENSENPAIVTDSFGYVHVFWSEDIGGEPFVSEENPHPGNSIVYTRWDGASWTPPMDVLFVPDEAIARFVAVDVDANDRLHAVWTGQSNLYYSSAPSWLAGSAHAWSKPIVFATDSARTLRESDIAADPYGNLHIVYATRGDDAGIYHIRSQDGGVTWGQPTKLSAPLDRLETGFANVQVISDNAGNLHAVWQTFQDEGYGQAVYYVRSLDRGDSWSEPAQLGYRDPGDFEASWPYLTARGDSELHLIYVDGGDVGSRGRFHRISQDSGATWSDPSNIITDMIGINGYTVPIVDGAGNMHLIVNMRTLSDQVVGIYYARWLGNGWSPVVPVDVESQSASAAHYTAAAVRLGNELHVVWTQLSSGEIWYIQGIIPSVAQTPPLFVPSPQPPTPAPAPRATTSIALPTPTPFPQPVKFAATSSSLAPTSSLPVDPLVISAGTSFLLVAAVLLWKRIRPH